MLVWLPKRLVAIATISRSVGKKARNTLYAMACEIMLHGGNTRKNARPLCLARAFTEIMEHQYKRDVLDVELLQLTRSPFCRDARHRPCRLPVNKMKRTPDSPSDVFDVLSSGTRQHRKTV